MVLPDIFLDQDSPAAMYRQAGLDAKAIVTKVFEALGRDMTRENDSAGVTDGFETNDMVRVDTEASPDRTRRMNVVLAQPRGFCAGVGARDRDRRARAGEVWPACLRAP